MSKCLQKSASFYKYLMHHLCFNLCSMHNKENINQHINMSRSFYPTTEMVPGTDYAAEQNAAKQNALTVTAVDFYNHSMLKIFGVNTQLFGHIDNFNPMYLPVPSAVEQLNVPNVQVPAEQQTRLQNYKKYIAFLTDNGYFSSNGALSGLTNSIPNSDPILNQVTAFIKNMEIQTNGQNVTVTLRDIVQMSTSVKSNPYYCDSMKLFIAILTAVKYINIGITQPEFEFSKPGMFSFSKSSGLQKSFVACSSFSSSPVPDGDPVATNYLRFNINALAAAAAAEKQIADNTAAEEARASKWMGGKSMRRNRRLKRARKTRRGRVCSHKRSCRCCRCRNSRK